MNAHVITQKCTVILKYWIPHCGILLSLTPWWSAFVLLLQVSWYTLDCNNVTISFLLGRLEMQSRLCQSNGVWSDVENSSCPSPEIVRLWEDVSYTVMVV